MFATHFKSISAYKEQQQQWYQQQQPKEMSLRT